MKSKRVAFHASLAIALTSAHAAERYWDGGTTDISGGGNGTSSGGAGSWNDTLLNWDQGIAPAHGAWVNGNTEVAVFGGGGGTVTLGSPVTANRLVFNTPGYVLTGSAANTLTLAGTTPTIVTNASAAIGSSSVLTNTVLAGTEGLTITGVGGASFSLMSVSAHTLSGGLLVKNGVTFNPSTRTYGGTTNLLDPNNALTFEGGHFTFSGYIAKTIDQTLGNATFNTVGSGTRLFVGTSSNASTTAKLHLGTISGDNLGSPGAGGLLTGLNAAASGTYAITTTTAPTATNGTYGTRVIYTGDGGGTTADWTAGTDLLDGTYQFAPYVNYTAMDDNGAVDTDDVVLFSSLPALQNGNQAHRTLKLISGTSLDIDQSVLTLESGGLISTGNALASITGAPGGTCLTVGAASGYELIIHPYNSAGTTISAVIGDKPNANPANPDHPVAVTVNNLNSNPLTLSGLNTYTGVTTINGTSALAEGKSSVIVAFNKNKDADPETPEIEPNPSALGAGTSVKLNGAVIQTNGTTASSDWDIVTTGNSGVYAKNGIQTLAGIISGSGTFSIDGDFSTGTIALAGANTFSGDIVLRPDARLTLANTNALQNATLDMSALRPVVAFSTATSFTIGGLKGYNPINLGTAAVSIGNNNRSNDYWAVLSGTTGSLTKIGTGIQTIRSANTYGGNTTVNSGVLKLDSIPQQTDVAVTVGGTGGNLNKNLTLPSSATANLYVGQPVSGPNILPGTTIVEVGAGTAKLSAGATASGATTASFAGGSGGMPNSPVIEVQSGATLDASALPGAWAVGAAQTLGGTGTVTGPISVSGDISPGVGAADLATTTGTLTTGNVTFSATGEYVCTLDAVACDTLAAGNLTVDSGAKISFTGTPAAASYLVATYSGPAPAPFATDATLPAGYSLDYTTPGQIKLVTGGVVTPPYDSWASAKGLSGADAEATADPDHDGFTNAIEFVIGGEPNPAQPASNSSALAPSMATTATDLVFTFRRTDASLTQPGIAIAAAYSSTLGGWTTAQHGVNGVAIVVTDDGFGAGVDKVEVSIPKALASDSKMFARLTANF
jgi:autotransporter-associated beta strand protein